MPRVTLPEGCFGLEMADGKKYNRRRGADTIEVSDRHATAIRRGWAGQTGVVVADEPHTIGTRKGRWCTNCQPTRVWNAWNTHCPKCGAETVLEEQQ